MGLPIETRTPAVKPASSPIRRSSPAAHSGSDSATRDTYTQGGAHADYRARELEEQRVKLFVQKNQARGQDVGMRRDGNGVLRAQWNSTVPGTQQPRYFASEQHRKDSTEFLIGEAEGARDLAIGAVKGIVYDPVVKAVQVVKDPVAEAGKAIKQAMGVVRACANPRETATSIGAGLHETYVKPFKDGEMRAAGNVTGKAIVTTAAAGYTASGFRPGQGLKTSSKSNGNSGGGKISAGNGSGKPGQGSGVRSTSGSSGSASSRSTQSASGSRTNSVAAKIRYTVDHGSRIPDDASITRLQGTASRKIGDFKGLKGATIPQLVARVPKNAVRAPWAKAPNGAEKGMKFQWKDSGGDRWELRIHGPDPSAPAGSNASKGWIYRVTKNRKAHLPDGKIVHKNAHKPISPHHSPAACNESHIPVKGNPVLP